MSGLTDLVLAAFTTPEKIGVTSQSMLWLLPLAASIAVVYKATKLATIKPYHFFREAAILFGSIAVFMLVTAVVLYTLAWLVT
jgi:hypothetical protein